MSVRPDYFPVPLGRKVARWLIRTEKLERFKALFRQLEAAENGLYDLIESMKDFPPKLLDRGDESWDLNDGLDKILGALEQFGVGTSAGPFSEEEEEEEEETGEDREGRVEPEEDEIIEGDAPEEGELITEIDEDEGKD